MKRIIPFIAAVLVALSAQAQTVKVRMADGNIVKYLKSDVKYVSFTRALHTPDGLEAVDLGLSSGTKWASMNIGATSVTDAGLYFAWGETTGYGSDPSDGRSFDNLNYELYDIDLQVMIKYNLDTDGKLILDPVDDAATVHWGSDWRMPTRADVEELVNTKKNTEDYEWTWYDGVENQFLGSSMPGWKIMSKKAGTVGNHIFLPVAGARRHEEMMYVYANEPVGAYWTSERYQVDNDRRSRNSYVLYLSNDVVNRSDGTNYFGLSVRPVHN